MPSHRWRPLTVGTPLSAVLPVVVAAALAVVFLVGPGPTGAGAAATTTDPPLQSLVIAQPLPGYTVAPSGPTNGPLTSAEFASQSTTPQRAEEQFNALAAEPDFGAFIRLWTDRTGPDQGANDVAVLLFRIPRLRGAEGFADGLRAPFAGAVPFDVPSIPGAHGYSVTVASPIHAVEQIVVFRAGQYVSMTELASSISASNPATLTPSQAVAVSFQQYGSLRHGDPAGSTDPRPSTTATPAAKSSGHTVSPTTVAEVAGLVALAALAMWLFAFRPLRRRRFPPLPEDPWEPGGIFDGLGATVPDHPGGWEGARRVPELAAGSWAPPRMVPELVPAPPFDPPGAEDGPSAGSSLTDSDHGASTSPVGLD